MRAERREEPHNRGALGDERVWVLFEELPTTAYAWRAEAPTRSRSRTICVEARPSSVA